jgi:transposase
MLSAVGVRGEFSFMVHEGPVNSEVFLSFLKRLMQDATMPVILIVDGHSIHKTKIVKDYVNELAGKLKIYYLPPYSPQLNPDEQVWAHVKREVAKKFVQSKVK